MTYPSLASIDHELTCMPCCCCKNGQKRVEWEEAQQEENRQREQDQDLHCAELAFEIWFGLMFDLL